MTPVLGAWAGTESTRTQVVVDAPPAMVSLEMFDANANGKVDQVKATFSENLASSTATAPWTLVNVPSGGTLASVSVSGTIATLTINEGAGAANTAVGTFTVALAASATGIRDAAGNQSSFAATTPADKAAPARTALDMKDVNGNGKVDQVVVTFSETLGVVQRRIDALDARQCSLDRHAVVRLGQRDDRHPHHHRGRRRGQHRSRHLHGGHDGQRQRRA